MVWQTAADVDSVVKQALGVSVLTVVAADIAKADYVGGKGWFGVPVCFDLPNLQEKKKERKRKLMKIIPNSHYLFNIKCSAQCE